METIPIFFNDLVYLQSIQDVGVNYLRKYHNIP